MRILLAVVVLLAAVLLFVLSGTPGALDAIGDAATFLVRPLVVPLVTLINQPAFAYVASAVVFLSALCVAGWFGLGVVAPKLVGLRRARLEIAALPKTAAAEWLRACERVSGVLKRHDALLPAWSAFAAEVVQQKGIPARRFAEVVEAQGPGRTAERGAFLAVLPGYYTSVGLILTFVGLVVALYFSARGFRSGDLAEARQAIVQLLNASAFKFLSSVAALAGALMLSIVHRSGTQAMRRRSTELVAEIDLYLQPLRADAPRAGDASHYALLAAAMTALTAEMAATRGAIGALQASLQKRSLP